jgi:caffeoyl-CoA O-methyltransferase
MTDPRVPPAMPSILTGETASYLAEMQPPADDIVLEMERHAERDGVPIADRSVAHLQAILARAADADRVLEFGTAIGYSTLHVARTGAEVVTMEVDEDRIAAAEEYLERAGVSVNVVNGGSSGERSESDGVRERATIHHGPALSVLDDLSGPFDVAFLDAVKGEYERYLERTLPMVPVGGVVVADNLLWSGDVPADDADVPEGRMASTAALRAFNEQFVGHDQLDAIVSPLGDGTGIATKVASDD